MSPFIEEAINLIIQKALMHLNGQYKAPGLIQMLLGLQEIAKEELDSDDILLNDISNLLLNLKQIKSLDM